MFILRSGGRCNGWVCLYRLAHHDVFCIVGDEGDQAVQPCLKCVMPSQDRTALADTPGSRLASECEVLLAEGNLGGLLDRLGEHINLIFNKLDGKDLECCSDILAHLASRVPPAELPDAVKNLVQALTTQACPSNAGT